MLVQLILTQLCCTLFACFTVLAQTTRRMSVEDCIASCLVLMLVQQQSSQTGRQLLASHAGAPLTKEAIWSPVLSVGYFFMGTKTNFKTFCERQSNLEASSFLEAALPNGQLRLLCITGD